MPASPGPDVFVVGAPRCGTTALVDFLGQHPEVHAPYVKEPHYFGSDLTTRRGFPTPASYLELYEGAGERRAIDGSTWYLYSRQAAREIHAFRPDAFIVVMVRDPVELLYSWHGHAVFIGVEPIEDFADALAAESARRSGVDLPKGSPREKLLYRDIPRFTEQIERYLDVFGRERVKIIVHDDFKEDNVAVVQDVARFLGIDPDFRPRVEVVNANVRPRSKFVQHLTEHQPAPVRRLVQRVVPRRLRSRLRHQVRELNKVAARRPPLDPALRRALSEEFAPEVDRLSRLLGRDLRYWTSPDAPPDAAEPSPS